MMEPTRSELLGFIKGSFNPEELETLCFQLYIPYHDLPGVTHEAKVRELIDYMQRVGHIRKLLVALDEARPEKYKATFGQLYKTSQTSPVESKTAPVYPASSIKRKGKENIDGTFVSRASVWILVSGLLFLILLVWATVELVDWPDNSKEVVSSVPTSASIPAIETLESNGDSTTAAELIAQVDLSALRLPGWGIFISGLVVSLLIGWISRILLFQQGRILAFFSEVLPRRNLSDSDYRRMLGCVSGAATLSFMIIVFILIVFLVFALTK